MKKVWYSVELANYYEQAAYELITQTYVCSQDDVDLYDRLDWLADIWIEIHYALHPEKSKR